MRRLEPKGQASHLNENELWAGHYRHKPPLQSAIGWTGLLDNDEGYDSISTCWFERE